MPIPDNWFRENKPADIVSKVAEITLAEISKWTQEELIRVGWLNNPIIDILYSMTSAGVWTARTNASGYPLQHDVTSYTELQLVRDTIGVGEGGHLTKNHVDSSSSTTVKNMTHITAVKEMTLVNGAVSDQELVASLAGFYGVIKLKGAYSSASVDGNTCALTFQDEDDAALTGVPASWDISMLSTQLNTDIDGVICYKGTDAKALEVDVDTGGGVGDNGKVIYLIYEYWYET